MCIDCSRNALREAREQLQRETEQLERAQEEKARRGASGGGGGGDGVGGMAAQSVRPRAPSPPPPPQVWMGMAGDATGAAPALSPREATVAQLVVAAKTPHWLRPMLAPPEMVARVMAEAQDGETLRQLAMAKRQVTVSGPTK